MKLHPFSVPYRVVDRGVRFGWAAVIGVAATSGGTFAEFWPFVLVGAVALAVLVLAYQYAYYQRFSYELAGDTLDIDSGVLSRREREIPLRRVQNVDVTRNVLQRALGIATLSVETAGGGSTEAKLECVSAEEAERLQTEIRRLKAGETADTEGEDMGDVLYELDDRSLLAYSFLSFDARVASGLAVLFPLLGPVIATLGFSDAASGLGAALLVFVVGVGALAVLLALWIASAAIRFVRFYGFRLRREGDDLRYERGLLKRYTGTIPLDKLQSVSLTENVLMRRVGYATLAVETAGYAPGDTPSGGSEAAVPFAPREDALALARTLEPFDEVAVERPPRRARRRYIGRYGILAGIVTASAFAASTLWGLPYWWLSLLLFPVAVAGGHYRWLHLGHAEGDEYAVTRGGFWSRSTTVVPYYRLQTVIESQSIFQRRWGLASVVYDTAGSRRLTGGDATAHDIEEETARSLVERAVNRLRATLGRQ
ncbi:PH domain-containing protein [Salarchaeum japonicum]|uniref:PH domain-containing protein n=1 Tax=Salarchaeum japonicum TaxID=555573 RepID=UPI003C764B20